MGDINQSKCVGLPVQEPLVAGGTRALKFMLQTFIQHAIGGGSYIFGRLSGTPVGQVGRFRRWTLRRTGRYDLGGCGRLGQQP